MSTERSRSALELFEDALELESDERMAFVADACRGDDELRARVEALLGAHSPAQKFLEVVSDVAPSPSSQHGSDPLAEVLMARPEFARALEGLSPLPRGVDTIDDESAVLWLETLRRLTSSEERFARREEVGRGGMGVVFRIWDQALRRQLAMKVVRERKNSSSEVGEGNAAPPGGNDLHTDARLLARFIHEARLTGRLDHPGVVPLHDVGVDSDGKLFFTMRLVDGQDLGKVLDLALAGKEGWTEARVLDVIVRVCETLTYAHSKGVLHRDLKPSNVMVGNFGETYVMDWGLAKLLDEEGTFDSSRLENGTDPDEDRTASSLRQGSDDEISWFQTLEGTVVGTPSFMPPEQAEGRVDQLDARSDVYSVGAMLYTLLAGRAPYTDPDSQTTPHRILSAVRRGPPDKLTRWSPDSPPELVAICEKAMARSRSDRYADMAALTSDLRAFQENRVVQAYRTGAVVELKKWVARNRGVATSLAGFVLVLVAALVISLVLLGRVENERNAKQTALGHVESERDAKQFALERLERESAEKSAALVRAEARRLLALSAAELKTDPTLALLLALEGAALEPGRIANNALLATLAELREVRTLPGHDGWAYGADFSPDGSRVFTCGRDGTARIWDLGNGEELSRIVANEPLNNVLVSEDGKRVFACGWTNVFIFDAESGRELRRRSFSAQLREIHFSPIGDRLWLCDKKDRISCLDSETLEPVDGFSLRHGAPFNLDVSIDGSIRLVVKDGVAVLWDAANRRVWRFAPFNRDRSLIAAAVHNSVYLVDAGNGKLVTTLKGHRARVTSSVFSPDGRHVATSSRDQTTRIWDARTGAELVILRAHQSDVRRCGFSRDGRLLVTVSEDTTARVWSLAPTLSVWPSTDSIPKKGRVSLYSPLGRGRTLSWQRDQLTVWNTTPPPLGRDCAGEPVLTLAGHTDKVWYACFSPGADRIVSTSFDKTARIWDAASGRSIATLRGHREVVLHASFSADSTKVVTAAADGSAAIWNAETGERLVILGGRDGHRNYVNQAAFSGDGERVVTGSHDWTTKLWQASTGKLIWSRTNHRGWVTFVGFFDNDRKVITGAHDNTVALVDAITGSVLQQMVGHEGQLTHADLHAAKGLVASLSRDGTARVWSETSGEEQLTIESPEGEFRYAAFSTDGESLYTLSGDRNIRKWPLAPLPVALAVKPRELTPEERDRFGVGTLEDRALRRTRRSLRFHRRNCDVARQTWRRLPEDWRTRARYSSCLRAWAQELKKHPEDSVRQDLEELRLHLKLEPREDRAQAFEFVALAEIHRILGAERQALRCLERAMRLPNATKKTRRMLDEQRKRFPSSELASFTSIDAALEEGSIPGLVEEDVVGRVGTSPKERDKMLSRLRKHAQGADAASRIAYLEGRILQLSGESDRAALRFEKSIEAGGGTRPEPFERLAACLASSAKAENAEKRLRSALGRGIQDSNALWNAWLRLCLVDLDRTPEETLAAFPAVDETTDDTGQGGRLREVLELLIHDGAVRINCGGERHVGADGKTWLSDGFFTSGNRYFEFGLTDVKRPFTGEILGTDEDLLYQSHRWFAEQASQSQGYRIPLAVGRYRVVLHFAEIFDGRESPPERPRTFDVRLEGRVVLHEYQPGAPGLAMATRQSFDVDVRDGWLDVRFVHRVAAPAVAAIEVERRN